MNGGHSKKLGKLCSFAWKYNLLLHLNNMKITNLKD